MVITRRGACRSMCCPADQSRLVFHRADPLQNIPSWPRCHKSPLGLRYFHPAARAATSALDYFRAPLFDWPNGVAIPHTGPGADDDLQDMLITYLKQLRDQGGELFAFGAKFPEPGQQPNPRPIDREFRTVQGVHDIHMNQGNPNPGPFAKDNGVFQDGGLILKFGSRYVGLFLRFATQWLPTDNATGHRSPGARPIRRVILSRWTTMGQRSSPIRPCTSKEPLSTLMVTSRGTKSS